MTALQDSQAVIFGELNKARETLDDDGYRALLATVQARLTREIARLALGEALRTLLGDEAP